MLGEVLFSRRNGVQEGASSAMDANGLWQAMSALPRLGERLTTYGQDPRVLEVQRRVARGERLAAEIVDEFIADGLPEREVAIGLLLAMFGAGVDLGVIEGVIGDEQAKASALKARGRQRAGSHKGGQESGKVRRARSDERRAHAQERAGSILFVHGARMSRDALCHDVVEVWAFKEEAAADISESTVRGFLKDVSDESLAIAYAEQASDDLIRKHRGAALSPGQLAQVRAQPLEQR